MVRPALSRHVLLACALGVAACGSEGKKARTQLVLVADTDIEALQRITFEVSAPGRGTEREAGAVRADGAPLTVGVVREDGPLGPITVTARGFAGDDELISRTSIVWFATGRTLVVPLHLLASCVDVACAEGFTCTEASCASAELDVDDLADWTGDAPGVTLPVGERDAQVVELDADAGEDIEPGPRPDGGVDAQLEDDAEVPEDAGDGDADVTDVDADIELDASEPELDAGSDAGTDAGPDTGVPSDGGSADAGDAATDAGALSDCGSAGSFNLQTDPSHCGTCSNVCPDLYQIYYNYAPSCVAASCGYKCLPLYANCDDLTLVNGCETYVGNDKNNCGACNRKCATGQTCVSGVCQ